MDSYIERVSLTARRAAQAKDWGRVGVCAKEILRKREDSAEGHFLRGLVEKASNRQPGAIDAFTRALCIDERRYDAAVELAGQYLRSHRYAETATLLDEYAARMTNSPRYLDMAGTIYMRIGLPERAWSLFERANELQPGVDSLRANLAACSVYVGKPEYAADIYRDLLRKSPHHQRNHYELSKIERAKDTAHVDQMKAVLQATRLAPDKNIYLYYALGKELEDLERWEEAFEYYKMAGDAAARVASYDVKADLRLIDRIIEICDGDWLGRDAVGPTADGPDSTPVFIVGLPRTGTTLTERILSCHSRVESAGETYLIQIGVKRQSGIESRDPMNPAIVEAAAATNLRAFRDGYLDSIAYKLDGAPYFIEKFPENFVYLGFIAKAFPGARIVCLNRQPLDACFALYKQSFFRYAYSLDDIGRYYVAHSKLHEHWRQILGERLIEVHYEDLVSDQEGQTRGLLHALGLDFEDACLHFERSEAASNTASAVQVREKIHTRSVGRWKRFAAHLQPLKAHLVGSGIDVD